MPREDLLSRPEFESIALDVDVNEADSAIRDASKGLVTTEIDDGVKYRTRRGLLVAIVQTAPSEQTAASARVAYRTEPRSELATHKASRIRDALDPYAVEK